MTGWKNKLLSLIPPLLLWFASSFTVSQALTASLERPFPPKKVSEVEKADAIVILGGMINNLVKHQDIIELGEGADRLVYAVELYREGKAKEIILTGGSGVLFFQKNPEAELAKKMLISLGVAKEHIIIENLSRNTRENALHTSNLLRKQKKNKIILVTSAFHMKRSLALFQKYGLDIIPFPCDYRELTNEFFWDAFVPTTRTLETTSIMLKEHVGYFVYRAMGYF
ncbi:MAG: YdcF family protein [Leptospiraceae bacterium]|nr:YdcF family protein [Leptospiraceae bacterium]